MFRLPFEVFVLVACIATVGIVAGWMLSTVGPAAWFSWHPVFMTLAFPCLMTMGRWSYTADEAWGLGDTASRRKIHGGIMAFATVSALVGYLAIFMAHYPSGLFFGYNFNTHKWLPSTKKVFHAIFGYMILIPAVFQAIVGVLKALKLSQGFKSHRFHGIMGKLVMVGGAMEMVVAVLFWGWPLSVKIGLITFIAVTLAYGVFMPRAESSEPEEKKPLCMKDPELGPILQKDRIMKTQSGSCK